MLGCFMTFDLFSQGPMDVHSGCLLSGLEVTSSSHIQQLALTNDHIIQGHHIQLGEMKITVYTVLGAYDDLKVAGRCLLSPPPFHLL